MKYRAPVPLREDHDLSEFSCQHDALSNWLIHRARKNHQIGASRMFIVTTETGEVAGYYALAAGSVNHKVSPGRIRRNTPDPIPVVVLGRLATHRDHEGRGIGSGMLKDAVLRTQQISADISIRAMICHAIDEQAKAFYLHHGFLASPIEPLTVLLPIQ